ncbi:hypothetical protein TSAR_009111 [Trichomalopsis sarcophagae]|uniref:Uncharacterized protein n=1 Tax=Trichomalopsis sarcophagae TaxID=543379 RepID=A0A232ESI6_9HYME|nr:hypothetical protein TSAR_009111 [Trichomalopsis sarcophagae]
MDNISPVLEPVNKTKNGYDSSPENIKRSQISIHEAIKSGNEDIVIKIICSNPEIINAREPRYNRTPLLVAVDIGYYRISEILLVYKCNPNAADIYGLTALHTAVSNRSPRLVKLLLDYGANVNPPQRFRGMTPLYMAVEYDLRSTVAMLLKKGASISDATVEGRNVLDVAMTVSSAMRRLVRSYEVKDIIERNRMMVRLHGCKAFWK